MPRTAHRSGPSAARRSPASRALRAALLLTATALVPLAPSAPAAADVPRPVPQPGPTAAFETLSSSSQPDWMSRVPDHTWLAAMSIPGTHESLAIHGGDPVQAQQDFGDNAQTLTAQYQGGIRAVDIRVRVNGGKFDIFHGSYPQNANFDDVLAKTQAFLAAHPGETVLMRLHSECTGGAFNCIDDPGTTDATRQTIFQQYVSRYPGLFYSPSVTGTTTVPQLGQVRGKIVLLGFENPHGGSIGLGVNGYNSNIEDAYTTVETHLKWSLVKANLDQAAADSTGGMFMTYSSANGWGTADARGPIDVAGGYVLWPTTVEGVNQYLTDYLDQGGDAGAHIGIVMMDFPGWKTIADIIARNPTYQPAGPAIWRVNPNRTYVNSLNGRCLSRGTALDSTGTGGLVIDRACQNPVPSSEQWTATNPSAYFDGKGYFWIKSGDGKCLTVPYNNGVTPPAGTQLLWWPCETRWFSGNQMWNVLPTQLKDTSAYAFADQWTGLCVTMDPATAMQATGKVTQDACPK
ncbi:Phosphatidylinositol-specific phospholipase C, X domain [Streptacidiphilus jiangxiensis]|uniref:1-phosphatidylinositol phosphodiesterase n=2 Tax=Streptacidiphilus jiangxiensis TaxID=235985 RepID=A0A1H7X8W8_STRJI|nr:Phosphatidylinositol-specific phospholipase C, X domain [Streptacidiphilus jiangxiensis]